MLTILYGIFIYLFFLMIKHMVITDGLFTGLITYVILDHYTSIGKEPVLALSILACAVIIIFSKWKVTFAIEAAICSFLWTFFIIEGLFGQPMKNNIVISIVVFIVNILLRLQSREWILEKFDGLETL